MLLNIYLFRATMPASMQDLYMSCDRYTNGYTKQSTYILVVLKVYWWFDKQTEKTNFSKWIRGE